jgi:Uma2 family endonuclease
MVAQPSPPLMTVDEYLELERHSDVKHEYIDGYVYAVAGGTSAQSVISANIIALLRPHLRGGPCRVRTSEMRVRLSATRYVYPDVSVSCDERDHVNSEQDEIHYPRLVVEVLSRTTQDYDRTDKFDLDRGCAALQDYVLVSTRRQSVHVYSRGDDGVWLLRPFGPGDDVLLPSIDFRTPIAALHEDVELPTGPEIRP